MTVEDTEYQAEYNKAAAALEAAAQATPVEEAKAPIEKEPEKAPEPAPEKDDKPDPIAELTARLEKAEKIAKDNQAWATRLAQENAAVKREQQQREREAHKPAILDTNPELADAIRHVVSDPAPRQAQEDRQAQWADIVERAHPGIFQLSDEDDLVKALVTKRTAEWEDPLVAIREITAEKLAHTERQVGKRFAAESAKLAQKSAMSVPGAGSGGGMQAAPDAALAEVQRIQKMSDKDFQAEVRRVKGY